ncbi:MAG: DNA polymerase Y family protein, partial [Proteobacteria bacterium]|nr:DNA polymerase Y family protein [Pseudomonadota bacterium]
MSRIVSVWFPAWPIERLSRTSPARVPKAEPFVLVEKNTHGLRIAAANTIALQQGVNIGASLADVRAGIPGIAVATAEPERDRSTLLSMVDWLGRYGPARNIDGPDSAWIDVTGVPHLFGGEVGLCADLARRLSSLGFSARIGLADTLGAAHALARHGAMSRPAPWIIAPAAGVGTSLANLPVAALRLDPDTIRLLHRLGLKRIGQLYGLPRNALAIRFRGNAPTKQRRYAEAAAAALLMRLDQALGHLAEPRRPLTPLPEALCRLAFPEPLLTADGISAALAELALMLGQSLECQGLGARLFHLRLYRSDGTSAAAAIGTSTACRDPAHVCRLLTEKLANLDAGFGIDVATLEAGRLEPFEARQVGLEVSPPVSAANLIDRLASRLGKTAVLVCKPLQSHIPELAESWREALDGTNSDTPGQTHGQDLARHACATPPRPCLMLPRPEPIDVIAEIPDGAPQRFRWRRLARRIVKSE